MRVYISADMEGVTGVAHWDEVTKGHADYPRFQRQMTREVVAVCEGALAAGASELLVKDAHATARNLDGRDLPREARLVSGWTGHPLCMLQGLEADFDAVLMVGYHSRAGSDGNVLSHTLSSSRVAGMRLNGRPASEFLLHAHAAAHVGVPVVLVAGDAALCAEVAEVSPACRTVSTMRGAGPAVVARHPDAVIEELRRAAQEALQGDPAACALEQPERYTLELTYVRPADAERASHYPGVERAGPASVAYTAPDAFEVLRALQFVV